MVQNLQDLKKSLNCGIIKSGDGMKMLGYSAKDEFKSFGKEIIHKNTFKNVK